MSYRVRLLLLASLQITLIFAGPAASAVKSDQSSSSRALQSSKQQNGTAKIWTNPGPVEKLDLVGGPGGRARAPKPPFTFVEEGKTGTSPKVEITDAQNNTWIAKFGSEVKAEVFATRIAWALGYFVDTTYFVPTGRINAVKGLGRAERFVASDGTFSNACFELRDKNAKFLKNNNWTWQNNPFVGTRELNGLKIVLMLTSNWDNKDARNESSNAGILEYPENGRVVWRYLITDWGGSMGRWGNIFGREKWDCEGFAEQTEDFVKFRDGKIKWGYAGKHTSDAKESITLADVKWLLDYVGRLTDDQIMSGLGASGATPSEIQCFTKAIRDRINQLKRLGVSERLTSTATSTPLAAAANQ